MIFPRRTFCQNYRGCWGFEDEEPKIARAVYTRSIWKLAELNIPAPKLRWGPLGVSTEVWTWNFLWSHSFIRENTRAMLKRKMRMRGCLQKIARISHFVRFQARVGPLGGVLHESHKVTTRPLRGLAVKALRNMRQRQ